MRNTSVYHTLKFIFNYDIHITDLEALQLGLMSSNDSLTIGLLSKSRTYLIPFHSRNFVFTKCELSTKKKILNEQRNIS